MALVLNGTTGIVVADGATIGSTSDTDAITIPSTGRITFNQAILAQAGIQPNANAYAATEVLDDYEEGTFTPAFTNGINAGASYTAQSGRYTKIGRQVMIEVDLDLNSFVANGSHVYVGNMPFTSNSAAPYGGGFFIYNGGWYTSLGQWLMIANATYAAFYRQSDWPALSGTSTGMSMGGNCRFVMFYVT